MKSHFTHHVRHLSLWACDLERGVQRESSSGHSGQERCPVGGPPHLCVTLSKFPALSEPQTPHLSKGASPHWKRPNLTRGRKLGREGLKVLRGPRARVAGLPAHATVLSRPRAPGAKAGPDPPRGVHAPPGLPALPRRAGRHPCCPQHALGPFPGANQEAGVSWRSEMLSTERHFPPGRGVVCACHQQGRALQGVTGDFLQRGVQVERDSRECSGPQAKSSRKPPTPWA